MEKLLIFSSRKAVIGAGLLMGLFVVYPSVVNLFFDIPGWCQCCILIPSLCIWALKCVIFFALCVGLLYFNLLVIPQAQFMSRLLRSLAITVPVWALYVGTSLSANIHADCFTSTLLFQFVVVCVACTTIGHFNALLVAREAMQQEIWQLQKEADAAKLRYEQEIVKQKHVAQQPANTSQEQAPKIIVPYNDKLLPLNFADIACFYSTANRTCVITCDGRQLPYGKTLDTITKMLASPETFYRANRQYLVNNAAIEHITVGLDSRLQLNLTVSTPEPIHISKNKAADFKNWFKRL